MCVCAYVVKGVHLNGIHLMDLLKVGGVGWQVDRSPPAFQVLWRQLVVHFEGDGVCTGLHWSAKHPQHLPAHSMKRRERGEVDLTSTITYTYT